MEDILGPTTNLRQDIRLQCNRLHVAPGAADKKCQTNCDRIGTKMPPLHPRSADTAETSTTHNETSKDATVGSEEKTSSLKACPQILWTLNQRQQDSTEAGKLDNYIRIWNCRSIFPTGVLTPKLFRPRQLEELKPPSNQRPSLGHR